MSYPLYNNPAYVGMQTIKQPSLSDAMQAIAEYVEKYSDLPVGSIGVSSAYRSPAQDRAVGGSGNGPHVSGKAIDFWLRSPEGKAYNSIYALCAAQALAADLGIKGIERISDGVSLHIDIGYRSSNWWAYQYKGSSGWCYGLVKDFWTSSWAVSAGIKRLGTSVTHQTIKAGSRGDDVRIFQAAINKFYGATSLTVDGIFGPACTRAAKQFQKDRGLTIDGIVGAQSWKALGV